MRDRGPVSKIGDRLVGLGAGRPTSATSAATTGAIAASVDLAGLELTCAPRPGLLTPCFADLVASVRDATGDVPAAVAAGLGDALTALFVDRRLTADLAPAASR